MTIKSEATRDQLVDILTNWAMSENLRSVPVHQSEISEEAYDTINEQLERVNFPWDWMELWQVTLGAAAPEAMGSGLGSSGITGRGGSGIGKAASATSTKPPRPPTGIGKAASATSTKPPSPPTGIAKAAKATGKIKGAEVTEKAQDEPFVVAFGFGLPDPRGYEYHVLYVVQGSWLIAKEEW